jgi:hypothetical protein
MSKPKTMAPKPERRWYRYRLRTLLLVLVATALAMGVAGWHFHEPRPACRTLPEVLASGKYDGFDVVQGPDRPGPYVDMGATSAGKGEPLSGSFWANGKTRKFHVPGVPGEEFRVVGLIPQDGGEPTYIVLRRHAVPASPVGQSTKRNPSRQLQRAAETPPPVPCLAKFLAKRPRPTRRGCAPATSSST